MIAPDIKLVSPKFGFSRRPSLLTHVSLLVLPLLIPSLEAKIEAIHFTEAEGYALSPSPLYSQPVASPAWLSTAGILSDGAAGLVYLDAQTNGIAVYKNRIKTAPGTMIGVSAAFKFRGIENASTENHYILGLGLSPEPTLQGARLQEDNAKLMLARIKGEAQYKIYATTAEHKEWKAAVAPLGSVGHKNGSSDWSDSLQLVFLLTKTDSPNLWKVSASLLNLDTAATVATLELPALKTSEAFYKADALYASFQIILKEVDEEKAGVSIHAFSIQGAD